MGYFDSCLYFSANQLARQLSNIAEEAFKDMDITPTQGFTLIAIDSRDLHTPSEIAKELSMNPSTITRFMDKLEKLGYLERVYYGRKTEVNITKKGQDKLDDIDKCWKKIHAINAELLKNDRAEKLTKEIQEANAILAQKKK